VSPAEPADLALDAALLVGPAFTGLEEERVEPVIGPNHISDHSRRAGLASSATAAGAPERVIMATIGHRSTAMVRRHIRQGSKYVQSASR